MATINIQIPDAALDRVVNAFAAVHGYQQILNDGTANPETKAQFARREMREYIRGVCAEYEGNVAGDAARNAAYDKAISDLG